MARFSYKTKLFLYFFIVFSVFTITIIAYQQHRERSYKRQLFEDKLDIYCDIILNDRNDKSIPNNLRITFIDKGGKVIYDNKIDSSTYIENHFSRPEIKKAASQGVGSDIRESSSLGIPFIYYSKKIETGFIRVAFPYDYQIKSFLKAEQSFLFLSISLFLISLIFLWIIAKRFGEDNSALKDDIIQQQRARETLKSEMTNAIAHELRTPVSAIRGYAETLCDNEISSNMRETFTHRIHEAAIRLSELLRDIGILSKLDEAEHYFETEEIDLCNIVAQVLEEFRSDIETYSITIQNELPNQVKMHGNNLLLHSIFRNLIENAIKYGGKWIVIKIQMINQDNKSYLFTISDTGHGIEEQYLSRIFERFFRINKGRSREDGGSGLGLSIVRHAVMFHGGEISASNLPTGGLSITFSLNK